MNKIHTKLLYVNYPDLYADKDKPVTESLMCFGFECGDGWFELIDKLSQELTLICKTSGVIVKASQVKEKFGTLRFYTRFTSKSDMIQEEADHWWSIVYHCIGHAENQSAYTCEVCGKHGERRDDGWIKTLCDSCNQKAQQ